MGLESVNSIEPPEMNSGKIVHVEMSARIVAIHASQMATRKFE